MFANIDSETTVRILDLYLKQTDKQVFIAYDKRTTDAAKKIIDSVERIHLGRGGDELFGRSWNRIDQKKWMAMLRICQEQSRKNRNGFHFLLSNLIQEAMMIINGMRYLLWRSWYAHYL